MNLTNLILACGGDDVKIQPLDGCFTKFDAANSRNPTRIQFGTNADVFVNFVPGGGVALRGSDQGIVVWLPRQKVRRAIASEDAPADPAEEPKFQKALMVQLALQDALASLIPEEQHMAEQLLLLLNDRIGSHECL